jgi:hypothetical protein
VNCRKLKLVEERAFSECNELMTINLNTVEEIEDLAFEKCFVLNNISL